MATDTAAVSNIEKTMGTIGLNMYDPGSRPKQLQVLSLLTDPANTGDLSLRLMLTHSSRFAINKILVVKFLTAFYTILWNTQSPLHKKLYVRNKLT